MENGLIRYLNLGLEESKQGDSPSKKPAMEVYLLDEQRKTKLRGEHF